MANVSGLKGFYDVRAAFLDIPEVVEVFGDDFVFGGERVLVDNDWFPCHLGRSPCAFIVQHYYSMRFTRMLAMI